MINTGDRRPLIHFTPSKGWMNDPNGPWYDAKDKLYHLYFQYTPQDISGNLDIHWGHATTKDLSTWVDHGVAIAPDVKGHGVFSGSVVIDSNNTSGFFDDKTDPRQRVVAIYTLHTPEKQIQEVAYSTDGGFTFTKYNNNPVIDVSSTQFRDPKVFWHEPSNQWIMVIAKSQEFKIQIFGSSDLKSWKWHLDFSAGLYGFQYECPGLFELPIEGTNEKKWVMLLAINPGMPLGGSANQYFIGDFDGYKFTPDDRQTRIHDFGKDYYAFQSFYGAPEDDGILGIAWASNWQYAKQVPASLWRGTMGVVRKHTLANVAANPETKLLTLVQKPVIGSSVYSEQILKGDAVLNKKESILAVARLTGVFDIDLSFTLRSGKSGAINVSIHSDSQNHKREEIRFGYDTNGEAFYVARGIDNEFGKNPFFTDKMCAYVEPTIAENGDKTFKVRAIADKNLLELFFNGGTCTTTNTFFMSDGLLPERVQVSTSSDEAYSVSVAVNELSTQDKKHL